MKELYKFPVKVKVTEEVRTQNEDGSATIKTVESSKDKYVFLKLPSRRDREEISLTYKEYFGKGISRGLPMADILRRNLLDAGGLYAKSDLENVEQILNKMTEVSNKIQLGTQTKEELDKLEEERAGLNTLYDQISRVDKEIWSKSAEAYAQDMTIHWAVLNLTFWDEDKTEIFPGITFESRLESFYEKSDEPEENLHILSAFKKAYICFYSCLLAGEEGSKKEYLDTIINEE